MRTVLPQAADLLNHPNNVLAVSYLKAIRRLGASILPIPIRRTGNYHDRIINPACPSASAIRGALLRGSYSQAYAAVPSYSEALIRRRFLEKCIPDPAVADTLLLSRLRSMSAADYAQLPDLSEGLENALRHAAFTASRQDELIGMLTGVRYPAARISRLCACALLQAAPEDFLSLPLPESALLLGLRKNPEMTALWKSLPLPVISSFTEWKKTAHPADLLAWSLWAQCCHLPDTLKKKKKTVSI